MHGQFVWYELTTPDPEAAIRFYPRFTNWGTERFDDNYTMWTHDGVPLAGIFRLNDEMRANGTPPNWMPYIESNDVDATAARAKSLGATILAGPDDIPGTGRFAVVQDPQGAIFGVYKSSNQSNAWDGKNVVGKFSWHELMTSDHHAAARFYQSLFGWEKISEVDMGDGLMYYMYGLDGNMYGGMFTTPKEMEGMHPFWLVYIHVKDVGKAVEIATKNGASIHRPQMDIPGGSIAILGDPQGAGFAVHHASAAPVAKAVAAVKAVAKKAADTVRAAVKRAKTKTKTKSKSKSKSKAKAKAPAMKRAAKSMAKVPARTKSKAAAKKTRAPSRMAKSPARKKTKSAPKKTKAPARRAAKKKK
jgi:predicted enzyme related to lactoylglutathione lyase